MSRNTRHVISAVICLAAGAHAVWWFATGRASFGTSFDLGLKVAQAIVGLAGALWFYARSRGASL